MDRCCLCMSQQLNKNQAIIIVSQVPPMYSNTPHVRISYKFLGGTLWWNCKCNVIIIVFHPERGTVILMLLFAYWVLLEAAVWCHGLCTLNYRIIDEDVQDRCCVSLEEWLSSAQDGDEIELNPGSCRYLNYITDKYMHPCLQRKLWWNLIYYKHLFMIQ